MLTQTESHGTLTVIMTDLTSERFFWLSLEKVGQFHNQPLSP